MPKLQIIPQSRVYPQINENEFSSGVGPYNFPLENIITFFPLVVHAWRQLILVHSGPSSVSLAPLGKPK
jgi:hypothetical protein